ncbi:hypothetical protein TUM17387_12780 [Shewanella carassii]|uniref:hypothetical protein n=1 Tax=Shewanella carassii TaxID=1987584 RepID=UPI001BF0C800|nr:hypothetical protein [Shewanella carassii]BCV65919.1 hypothetical protein TUM17387_12780 [Shewanella carassii]
MNSAISRRLENALLSLFDKDYEASLLHCFPAIDKTASKRRPNVAVGKRFKAFLSDQRNIIAPIGLGVKMGKGCTFGGMSFEEAIYDLARNHLVHEGEFADSFEIKSAHGSRLGGSWELSSANILALIVATLVAEENKGEAFSKTYELEIFGQKVDLNTLWGKEELVTEIIDSAFEKPNKSMHPTADASAD